jgi:soluble lytic murein transglycosylase
LRAARQSREAGDLAEAAVRLEAVARDHPISADHASALRAEVLTEDGEPGRAVAVLLEAIAAHPESSLRAGMFRSLGNARLGFGDESGARAAWAAALRTRDRSMAPELILGLAESHERDDDSEAAYERYLELWLSFPDSAQGALAGERLDALEAVHGDRKRSAADWQKRADRLFRAHHNEAALASYDRALALGLSTSQAARAAKQRAHTLFRMRRYDTAVEAFGSLPRSAEQRLWHARSLARSDQVPASIEALESLAREGHGAIGIRASFLAGLLLDGRDRHDEARAHFERVASSRRHSGLSHGALWRLAWREYQDGECEAALPRLAQLSKIEKDSIVALRSRYWHARCLEALGRPAAADEFTRIATYYPFTYYGWRASFRARPDDKDARAADRELRPGKRRLPTRALARARILISAGYSELALRELRVLKRAARSLAERLELAQLLSDAGDFHAAQRIVVDGHVGDLARGPAARHEEMWWYAWPVAFGEAVNAAVAQPGAAERELVYAVMREESGYRPEVLSVSGAYGLMQIMPTTGERLARDLGRKRFTRDDLLVPRVNVALGAFYLGELGGRFPTRLSAAVASYNAGPEAVASWLVEQPDRLDDEWVEAIPYDQTRGYVKKVLRSLHAYRVLY